jgi:hypothetical protein
MRLVTKLGMAASACVLASAGLAALGGPVSAKGIPSAVITGPGLDDPIDVPPTDGESGKLAALTGFWDVMPGQPHPPTFTERAPAGQPGPRYTITWRVLTGPDETTGVRQDVYPHAQAGPLVHTAAGQPVFDTATVGGWYAAPFALRDLLSSLGVPAADAAPAAARSSATSPRAAPAPSPDDSPWPAVIVATTGAVALAGAAGALAVRRARRRGRVAPIPL